ncbi:bcl-2-binding component 3, isoforms 3/4-like [Pipistrellus kuhlii]|uniref:bcl-2-binding component 3, isoforms 3/4-like n=1 Tax=Pipistrellus kuhlii TaxID=59472 RepID=UPI001E26EC70|nr:bcl-2-binding component 3, isoforms 3/4-like [Pipistrellus kuhlii]
MAAAGAASPGSPAPPAPGPAAASERLISGILALRRGAAGTRALGGGLRRWRPARRQGPGSRGSSGLSDNKNNPRRRRRRQPERAREPARARRVGTGRGARGARRPSRVRGPGSQRGRARPGGPGPPSPARRQEAWLGPGVRAGGGSAPRTCRVPVCARARPHCPASPGQPSRAHGLEGLRAIFPEPLLPQCPRKIRIPDPAGPQTQPPLCP